MSVRDYSSYACAAAHFGFTDPSDSPADNLAAVKITTLPGAGSLKLSGVAVTAGQLISKADLDAGHLTFAPAANANGAGYASFTFQVQDDGGTANGGVNLDQSPNTLTIDVTAVNDEPSFTKGANQTVLEDAGAQSVSNWATAISAGPADESGQILTFHVSNNNTGLFSSQPALTSSGTLSYTPAPNANGSATVSVYVTDNGGTANGGDDTSATQTFTITVTAVNDEPSFTKGANQTVLEDAGAQSV